MFGKIHDERKPTKIYTLYDGDWILYTIIYLINNIKRKIK